MQYLPYLRDAGFEVEEVSFFDDAYLQGLYSGRPMRSGSVLYFLRRVSRLLKPLKADLIWLEKEAFPWLPWPLEKQFLLRGVPVVSDFDDAIFHRYDRHKSALIRMILGRKIDHVMSSSTLVTAGNGYLAGRAEEAGASRVEIIPTVIDALAYSSKHIASPDGKPRVGWIGTPNTWANFGAPMMDMLRATMRKEGAVFRAVGAGQTKNHEPDFEFLPWSEDTEINLIQGMDVGIMPLSNTPWARGKCGYKLIQYMACGLPVISSPVGVNCDIVEHGVNGFLASTDAEWREAVTTLLADGDLRRRMGAAGRKKVEVEYSIQVQGPRIARLLREVTETHKK